MNNLKPEQILQKIISIRTYYFSIKKIILILILITGFFMSFFGLGERTLEKWDEETNREVVLEINKNNSFTDLKLNNEIFFEKPPLWYYSTAIVERIFGESNFSLRFISAFSGFMLLILIILFCKRNLNENIAIFSGLTFLSTNQLFYLNPDGIFSSHFIRSADLDLMQLLFLFLSIFMIIEFEKSKRFRFLIFSSLLCGLSILTKGFIGVLIPISWILFLIVDSLFKKKFEYKILFKKSFLYFLFTVIIAAPWHIYMISKYGNDFFTKYFIYHNFDRITETIEQHYGYTYFHFNNLFNLNFFSSGIFLILGILLIIYTKRFFELNYGLITIYTILVLITITLVETKLAWYLLYIYPTAVIICGIFYEKVLLISFKAIEFTTGRKDQLDNSATHQPINN